MLIANSYVELTLVTPESIPIKLLLYISQTATLVVVENNNKVFIEFIQLSTDAPYASKEFK